MAVQFPLPKFVAYDSNGAPLNGGKLYCYVAGTNTSTATYTDPAASTANAYPVVLDSRGEANVWVPTTSAYKFSLTTSSDVAIWTVDSVQPIASAQTLAVSSGAANIGFIQTGASAVATTVQAKARQIVCVFDFMTAAQIADVQAGTALLDVTAAIQAAQNTGEALFFPAGTYLISGITADEPASWYGEWGATSITAGTIVKASAAGTKILEVTDAAESNFSGILFQGTSDTTEKGEDVTSIGVKFNCTSSGNIDAVFENCGFIYLQDDVEIIGRNVRFHNCIFSNSKRGVYVSATQPADVRGLEMYGCRYHSMGKDAASNSAAVYIDPAANFQEVVIGPFDSDDCLQTFYGFAGMTRITGVINKARSHGVNIVATGHGASNTQRAFDVTVQYRQANATTVVASAVKADNGAMFLRLDGCTSFGSGGHGFDIASARAQLVGCVAHNPGQETTNTYDAFNVSGSLPQISACHAYQDRIGTATNKGRWGFNVSNPTAISGDCWSDAFTTGKINPISPISIAASGGTKVFTLTFGGSASVVNLELALSGTMGGSFTKAVGKILSISFALSSDTVSDSEVITLAELGDAEGADITAAIAAVGSGNQATITLTNAHASDAFAGEVKLKVKAWYNNVITAIA